MLGGDSGEESGDVKMRNVGSYGIQLDTSEGCFQAVLDVDGDGIMRLRTRILPHKSPVGSIMEEVARLPHVP